MPSKAASGVTIHAVYQLGYARDASELRPILNVVSGGALLTLDACTEAFLQRVILQIQFELFTFTSNSLNLLSWQKVTSELHGHCSR